MAVTAASLVSSPAVSAVVAEMTCSVQEAPGARSALSVQCSVAVSSHTGITQSMPGGHAVSAARYIHSPPGLCGSGSVSSTPAAPAVPVFFMVNLNPACSPVLMGLASAVFVSSSRSTGCTEAAGAVGAGQCASNQVGWKNVLAYLAGWQAGRGAFTITAQAHVRACLNGDAGGGFAGCAVGW